MNSISLLARFSSNSKKQDTKKTPKNHLEAHRQRKFDGNVSNRSCKAGKTIAGNIGQSVTKDQFTKLNEPVYCGVLEYTAQATLLQMLMNRSIDTECHDYNNLAVSLTSQLTYSKNVTDYHSSGNCRPEAPTHKPWDSVLSIISILQGGSLYDWKRYPEGVLNQ